MKGATALMRRKNKDNLDIEILQLKETAPSMEAYRILRTNIEFSSTIKPIKKLLITSSILGEGKSTTVTSLAKIFAAAGKKTLIIDLDLRRPVQHKLLAISNEGGIMELLSGMISIEEAIKTTNVKNLYLLNCGTIPPNPADLLSSSSLQDVLDKVSADYDFIIIDSPPAAALADAAIISRFVDATLLVVSAGVVRYNDVENALTNLKNSGANVLGMVMNNVTKETGGYKYYYYYRYY